VRSRGAELVFGCAAALLSYPDDTFAEDLEAVRTRLAAVGDRRARTQLAMACSRLGSAGPTAAAARYVDTFDLARRRTLHLTYYRHGDTRERGAALAELADAYRAAGVRLRPGELPDFLPAMLELAAVHREGVALLGEFRAELDTLQHALERAESPYATVVGAVTAVLGTPSHVVLPRWRRSRPVRAVTAHGQPRPLAPPEVLAHGITTRGGGAP